jgi:hypothetical protein
MADEPGEKAKPKTPKQGPDSREAGQLGRDDRGNITWHWKDDAGLLADDQVGDAERVRALVNPAMDVLDEDDPDDPTAIHSKRLKTGYNPYNSGALGKQVWKKSKDLRELSKWIDLRKKVADKKGDQ